MTFGEYGFEINIGDTVRVYVADDGGNVEWGTVVDIIENENFVDGYEIVIEFGSDSGAYSNSKVSFNWSYIKRVWKM